MKKINGKNLGWSFVTPKLSSLLPAKKIVEPKINSYASKTSFAAFSKNSVAMDRVPTESIKNIDMALLQDLTRTITGESQSFRGFISSQLQHGPVDSTTKSALKRAVAVKKMLTLINTTVDDMHAIELKRISFSKG